ncbi:MAG TPA: hypothetical protein ENK91_02120, partial [Bacteroidetes bacterium]|nr:hypothetical protein [Bacteroidota bacterium]
MKVKYFFIISLLIMVFAQFSFAQNISVSGKVTDANEGDPLTGVSVQVKGTTVGTITDLDGMFKLNVPSEKSVLVFSYVGYKPQEVVVGSQRTFNIGMELDVVTLEDIVIVGYGSEKKENLTGAVTAVNVTKTLPLKPVADVARALKGVVPGLTITNATGKLNDEAILKLRGYGSVNGPSNPLVLIDGVEGKLSDINPESIEKVTVLKDAASASIYGARAAFGVILITTKQGKAGKTVVNYS